MADYFPFILPAFSKRKAVRSTLRGKLGDHVLSGRKEMDVFHKITYVFPKLTNREYTIIDDSFRSCNGGVTSINIPHWGDPRLVSAISGDRVSVHTVKGLSSNVGDGGNRVLMWKNSGDYGRECSVSWHTLTDTSKSWSNNEWQDHKILDSDGNELNASSNTSTGLIMTASPVSGPYLIYQCADRTLSNIDTGTRVVTLNASPVVTYSAKETFVIPVYECYYAEDELGGLKQTGEWNKETNEDYGPFWQGEISFIQKGTGT